MLEWQSSRLRGLLEIPIDSQTFMSKMQCASYMMFQNP